MIKIRVLEAQIMLDMLEDVKSLPVLFCKQPRMDVVCA
jgi:hypothetical protein